MSKSWGRGYFINKNKVNVLDDQQFSWLHRACILEDFDTVVELVEQGGANVNIQGNYKDTPLHNTVYTKNFKITKYLLDAGADVNIKNEAGSTVIDDAKKCTDPQILNLLYRYKVKEIQNHEVRNPSVREVGQADYNQLSDNSLDSSSQSDSDYPSYSGIEVICSGEGIYNSDSE